MRKKGVQTGLHGPRAGLIFDGNKDISETKVWGPQDKNVSVRGTPPRPCSSLNLLVDSVQTAHYDKCVGFGHACIVCARPGFDAARISLCDGQRLRRQRLFVINFLASFSLAVSSETVDPGSLFVSVRSMSTEQLNIIQ